MWDLKTLIRMNAEKDDEEIEDPNLELDLYQAKHVVSRCKKDPDGFAKELYAALCNVTWKNVETGKTYTCSWRYAGGIVSTMAHDVDDYTRYYNSGDEGVVTDDVLTELVKLGWEPTEEEDEKRTSAGSAP